jgi:ABC-2 type transport system permease protein
MNIIMPFLYVVFYSPLLKNFSSSFPTNNVIDTFIPGMLVMISFYGGFFAGYNIIDELRSGVIERFRVTPASRFAILAGTVFEDMITTICQIIFFTIISLLFGFRINFYGFLTLIVLLSLVVLISSSISNALGVIVKSEDKLSPIIQGINLPILLLSGMLLPISLGPTWLKILAHFNPLYYVVEAARCLSQGLILNSTVAIAFIIIGITTFISMKFAAKVFSKAVF